MSKTPSDPLKSNAAGQALVLTTLALLALGVVMVHSAVASVARPGPWYARVDMRHTLFAAAACIVLLLCWRIDYHILSSGRGFPIAAAVLLGLSLLLGVLVFVPGIGHQIGGQYRWIRIGPPGYNIGLQPSELIKLSLVVFLAAWLTRPQVQVRSFRRTFLPAACLVGAAVALVITQDFGTALLIAAGGIAVMLFAGLPLWHLLTMVPAAAAAFYFFVVRSEHRWLRIMAMIDPWSQTNPSSYQARQSLMAILNGGWWGRGPGNGFRKLGYLPEDSTDFIFAVYCEEWGFVGAMLLIGLVALWIWAARRAAVRAPDAFGRCLAASLGFVIALQAVLHVAVDLVAAPPTGMGLPFVSAGGTALVILSGAAATIVSVSARSGAVGAGPKVKPRKRPAGESGPAVEAAA